MEKKRTVLVEVCCDSIASVRMAIAGGCHRIELCAALAVGGLTPSLGLVRQVRKLTRLAEVCLVVLVRLRGGGFHFEEIEIAAMEADVESMREYCDGFVIGALTVDGKIDVQGKLFSVRRLICLDM